MLTREMLTEFTPEQHAVLALDELSRAQNQELAQVAREAGGWAVKIGLETLTAIGPHGCAELAARAELEWIADFKLYGPEKTLAVAVDNLLEMDHPPAGITIAGQSGLEALTAAQQVAKDRSVLFGVGLLTTIDLQETARVYRERPSHLLRREMLRMSLAGLGGVVCSGEEAAAASRATFISLVPGTRTLATGNHEHRRVTTAARAMAEGADLLVLGREVAAAEDPLLAYRTIAGRIAKGLERRRTIADE